MVIYMDVLKWINSTTFLISGADITVRKSDQFGILLNENNQHRAYLKILLVYAELRNRLSGSLQSALAAAIPALILASQSGHPSFRCREITSGKLSANVSLAAGIMSVMYFQVGALFHQLDKLGFIDDFPYGLCSPAVHLSASCSPMHN